MAPPSSTGEASFICWWPEQGAAGTGRATVPWSPWEVSGAWASAVVQGWDVPFLVLLRHRGVQLPSAPVHSTPAGLPTCVPPPDNQCQPAPKLQPGTPVVLLHPAASQAPWAQTQDVVSSSGSPRCTWGDLPQGTQSQWGLVWVSDGPTALTPTL